MSQADEVLREIERMIEDEFLPIIGPKKGNILVKVIQEVKPKNILEVGTLIGYSAILMGKHLDKDVHLTSIEIHAEEAEIAKKNIARANIPPKIEVIVGDAKTIIPRLKGKFDLVFIDAAKTSILTT